MIFGKKGGISLVVEKLIKLIMVIAVLIFLFYFLKKIIYGGELFLGLFD